ncbi:flagellar hook-length control protein FliK [Pseudomonas sp. RIT-PI-AD]|uniref:flagellar hook-length control protein FliK n=1 Tax=Pseudomonas sp. RIT-PI-AD TaxID=3035294 RepID=UPI0021DB01E1|nr:flagellar hook-length control protein FliK [Pseudomonas sp. RIT-PI-AD]
MSVAPDLLLQTTPDVKSKSAAKSAARTMQASGNEASSFANLYAKERQAKPAERSESTAKPATDKNKGPKAKEPADDTAQGNASPVADSGKPLPAETAKGEASATDTTQGDGTSEQTEGDPVAVDPALDPLLLMAMAGQMQPAVPPVAPPPAGGEGEAATDLDPALTALAPAVPATPGVSGGPASLTEASHDPTQDELNSALTVKLTLEQGAQAQTQSVMPQSALNAAPVQQDTSAQADFSETMAALLGSNVEAADEPAEAEVALVDSKTDAIDGLADPQPDARDAFANKLNALNQAMGQQSAAQKAPPLVPGQPVALQQNGWSEAVVDRVMWLSSQNLKSAEIQLDPAELGRLEVRVNLGQDQATQVTFASPNANVRDALEGQMHRLRELFSQQGMNQLDVSVSDQSLNRGWQGQQQSGNGGDGSGRGSGRGTDGGHDEVAVGISEIRHTPAAAGRSLVDYYA